MEALGAQWGCPRRRRRPYGRHHPSSSATSQLSPPGAKKQARIIHSEFIFSQRSSKITLIIDAVYPTTLAAAAMVTHLQRIVCWCVRRSKRKQGGRKRGKCHVPRGKVCVCGGQTRRSKAVGGKLPLLQTSPTYRWWFLSKTISRLSVVITSCRGSKLPVCPQLMWARHFWVLMLFPSPSLTSLLLTDDALQIQHLSSTWLRIENATINRRAYSDVISPWIVTHIICWDTYDQFFENTNSLCVGENIDETNTEEVYDRFIHTITSSW